MRYLTQGFLPLGRAALAAALFSFVAADASAINVDLDYDYTSFQCPGCFEYDIHDKPVGGVGETLSAILKYYNNDGFATPRTRVAYDILADSTFYVDVANSALYIAAGAEGEWTNRGVDSPPGEFFNTDVQIYMQFVDGVDITTDANGVPISVEVAGASDNNAGYFVWDDSFYAAFVTGKANGDGFSAVWDETSDYFNSWLMGIATFLNHDGSPNTGLNNQLLVLGDFHFDTSRRSEVPEPMSLVLLASALGGGGMLRRKKRAA